jgi:hypothetical protein
LPTYQHGYALATDREMQAYKGKPRNPIAPSEMFGSKGGAKHSCADRRAKKAKARMNRASGADRHGKKRKKN